MIKNFFTLLGVMTVLLACAQDGQDLISEKEVLRIESFLASDELRGRRAGTPEIDKAAAFIAEEFKKSGLQPMSGNSFLQTFSMLRPKNLSLKYECNGQEGNAAHVVVITSQEELKVNEKSGYNIHRIAAGEPFIQKAQTVVRSGKNAVVFVDSSFSGNFSRLNSFKRQIFRTAHNTIFILAGQAPKEFTVKSEHSFEEIKYTNVVGVLPGKSKKNEYVVFSAHYDHIGVARQPVNGDSIYNGANDDAAGTTAVMLLADHFSKVRNNERSIVFAAFTAEEAGGYGSQYFTGQLDPHQVMAMFNIEMIGTQSQWGRNSAYITGYEKSNMGEILQKNLDGTGFSFHPDPYPDENLFYRSDNATLARLGVPAHTISTAKMDNEPNYHKVTDEVSALDTPNMTQIIKAIALSSQTIVSGKDTPTRVSTSPAAF